MQRNARRINRRDAERRRERHINRQVAKNAKKMQRNARRINHRGTEDTEKYILTAKSPRAPRKCRGMQEELTTEAQRTQRKTEDLNRRVPMK